jgi:acyl-CoA thioesterase I
MNPVLLYFASGESLYSGAAFLALIVAISPFLKYCWLLRVRNVVALMALVLIVMACPPFAWIVDAIFGAAFLLWFIAWNKTSARYVWTKIRLATMGLLFFLLLVLPAAEFSHRRMPVIEGEASDHLVVIGDSISSGLGTRVPPWPVVMQQMARVEVRNLSRAGATVSDGVPMADKVNADEHLILIELGGNDLIAGEPSDVFARGLEAVLARLTAPGRTLVMFELPLLPDKIAYGQIQRRLASQYGVSLIPKRYLIEIIAGPEATSDGLHLTDVGARRMAAVVAQILLPVLETHVEKSTDRATRP